MFNGLVTGRFACSKEAGAFMFGKKDCHVLLNAIDVDSYTFRPDLRQQYRQQYGLSGKTVLGHVGTFSKLKNQSFLVEVLAQWRIHDPNGVLVLVGEGPQREAVAEKAAQLGVADGVIFTRACDSVHEMLNMFDYFLFPSLSEGFGIAPVEAQANGLPVVAAQGRMPEMVKIHDNFRFVPLEAGASGWCDALEHLCPERCPDGAEQVRRRGFDRMETVNRMRRVFLSMMKE